MALWYYYKAVAARIAKLKNVLHLMQALDAPFHIDIEVITLELHQT